MTAPILILCTPAGTPIPLPYHTRTRRTRRPICISAIRDSDNAIIARFEDSPPSGASIAYPPGTAWPVFGLRFFTEADFASIQASRAETFND